MLLRVIVLTMSCTG